jgi:hypothetical protein
MTAYRELFTKEETIEMFNELTKDEEFIYEYYLNIVHNSLQFKEEDKSSANEKFLKIFPNIVELTERITEGVTDDYQKAKIIHDCLWNDYNDHIDRTSYSSGYTTEDYMRIIPGLNYNYYGMIIGLYELLENKEGNCNTATLAFKTMCYIAGIPSVTVMGQIFDQQGHLGDHAWNIFWYSKEKRWVICDVGYSGVFDPGIEKSTDWYRMSYKYSRTYANFEGSVNQRNPSRISAEKWRKKMWLESIEINPHIVQIGDKSFGDCINLTKVIIPDSVTSIHKNAFLGSPVTIYCNSGSYAESWAKETGTKYEIIK